MSLKTLFAPKVYTYFADGMLLLMRIIVGLAFMFHGWGKIQNPFGWMGDGAWAPGILQALAALSEFGGGFLLIIGLLTPLAALGIACTMTVAFATHAFMRGDPFVAQGGGGSYELALVYLSIMLVVLALGPGRFSLDRVLFGLKDRRTDTARDADTGT